MTALFMATIGAVLAQSAPITQAATSATTAQAAQINSIWDFIIKGGPVMVPIFICSFVALTIVVERLITLRRTAVIPPGFVPELRAMLGRNPTDRKAALEYCRRSDSPIASIFAAAVKRLHEPAEVVNRHIEEAGERAIFNLRKYLRGLSVIASLATMLGLLGTITGMINAFQTVAASAEALGRTELLARGIYEAMITTAAGLIVAIPVIAAYHGLSARIDRLVMEMDQITVDFVEEFVHASPAERIVATASLSRADLQPARVDVDGRPQLATATA